MPLIAQTRPALGRPLGALVLLHGRGTDETDLAGLAAALDPAQRLVIGLPRAPLSDGAGNSWYRALRPGYPVADSFAAAQSTLAAWLNDLLAEQGLDHAHTILGGFSQGGVMTLGYALSAQTPSVAGIQICSARLPISDGFTPEFSRLRGLPAFVSHGVHDPIIPIAWGRRVRDALESAGAVLTYREFTGGHEIDDEGVRQACDWVQQRLQAWATPG